MFVPGYDEPSARRAIVCSLSYAEALGKLGLRPAGGNHAIFRRYVDEIWKIPTDHFDAGSAQRRGLKRGATPLREVMVEHSGYSRSALKARLFATGLKPRHCELCGQGEMWRGVRMALILDHINGVPDDNRLTNLRIVCPNCAATFDTHCGRHNRQLPAVRECARCGAEFAPRYAGQRHCSRRCGTRHANRRRRLSTRRVERPTYARLLAELEASSFVAVGRRYGVSDNAIRKWVRAYEAEEVGHDSA